MRDILITLNDIFGAHHSQALTTWFNQQTLRQATIDEQVVSLFDVEQTAITAAIKRVMSFVPLSAEQLVEHTFLVPALDTRQLDLECVARFRSSFYAHVLCASAQVSIDNAGIVKHGDTFERYGHDKHVIHKPLKDNPSNECVAAYINGSVEETGYTFSVVLNQHELEGVRQAHVNTLFNGVSPYEEKEWDDVYLSAVFERLLDEEAFAYLSGILDDNAVGVLKAISEFNAERYKKHSKDKAKVYSSYGKLIAVKKHRFSAMDRVNQKRIDKPTLKLVASNGSTESASDDNDASTMQLDDIAQDFGGF